MYRLKFDCVSGIALETKDTIMRTPTLILHHTHIHTQGNNRSNKRHLKHMLMYWKARTWKNQV